MRSFELRLGTAMTLCLCWAGSTCAAKEPKVEPFSQTGLIVSTAELFPAAYKAAHTSGKPVDTGLSSRALVTSEGVFAFLESPENQAALAKAPLGMPVAISGKVLVAGSLLHVEKVDKAAKDAPRIDLAGLRRKEGKPVSLAGRNLCQCSLSVSDLPHSCKLGHLHHLQADDGRIYHYLTTDKGQATLLGQGSHQKNIRLKARLLPGNFLLVEEVKVGP